MFGVRVVLFAAAVPLVMRFVPLFRLGWWVTPSGGAAVPLSRSDVVALIGRIDRLLMRGHPLVRRGCITRGLTLYRFLRRAGVPVSLRFGMGLIDGRLEGHCWLVCWNEPLGEKHDPRGIFTETWAIPA